MHRFLLVVLLAACSHTPEPSIPLSPTSEVVMRVVDGDTVVVGKEHVRIIGIDTPEKEECYFEESSDHLRRLVLNTAVELVPQPTDNRDKYGRLLRYVHVADEDIGLQMLRLGYARNYPWFSHPRMDEYSSAEKEAQNANRGLWGECG